jgi:hypothetical protein
VRTFRKLLFRFVNFQNLDPVTMALANWLMQFRGIVDVYSENHKPIKRLRGQNTELVNVNAVVHIVTTMFLLKG